MQYYVHVCIDCKHELVTNVEPSADFGWMCRKCGRLCPNVSSMQGLTLKEVTESRPGAKVQIYAIPKQKYGKEEWDAYLARVGGDILKGAI